MFAQLMTLFSHFPTAGLFSHINFVITHMDYAQSSDFIVDWTEGMLYTDPSGGNLFELLFRPLPAKNATRERCNKWPHYSYTSAWVSLLYEGEPSWRNRLHQWWAMFEVREEILEEVSRFCAGWKSPVLAMHIRNDNIGAECPGYAAPSLADYERALDALSDGSEQVFLATDNDQALEHFIHLLGSRLLYRRIPRGRDMNTEFHITTRQTVEDARNCLVDALVMSRCEHLIHSVSNIATAVLYMNPAMGHTFVLPGGFSSH